MQPLVVRPVNNTLSTPSAVSVEASEVPKNALGYCFEITSSSASGTSPSGQAPIGLPATKWRSGAAFSKKRPPSIALG